jgi:hypothetical protein
MGIILSLSFAVIVIGILFAVWAINGAESRKNAREAARDVRENRTVRNTPPPRGTGID